MSLHHHHQFPLGNNLNDKTLRQVKKCCRHILILLTIKILKNLQRFANNLQTRGTAAAVKPEVITNTKNDCNTTRESELQ